MTSLKPATFFCLRPETTCHCFLESALIQMNDIHLDSSSKYLGSEYTKIIESFKIDQTNDLDIFTYCLHNYYFCSDLMLCVNVFLFTCKLIFYYIVNCVFKTWAYVLFYWDNNGLQGVLQTYYNYTNNTNNVQKICLLNQGYLI